MRIKRTLASRASGFRDFAPARPYSAKRARSRGLYPMPSLGRQILRGLRPSPLAIRACACFLNPDDVLLKATCAQRPILGDSGPLQWSKKAKMSAQILKVIPLSFIVCRFVLKLRLVPGIPQRTTSTARMMNIGLLGALNRNVQREFDTSRKDTHWGRRKLKRDE